jgi:hypothetical protein
VSRSATYRQRVKAVFVAVLSLLLLVEPEHSVFAVLAFTPLAPMNDASSDESEEGESEETSAIHLVRRVAAHASSNAPIILPQRANDVSRCRMHFANYESSCGRVFPLRC